VKDMFLQVFVLDWDRSEKVNLLSDMEFGNVQTRGFTAKNFISEVTIVTPG